MSDLFKKLNLLIKSNLGDLVGDSTSRRDPLPPERLGKDIDREVKLLRQQVNAAVDHESKLNDRAQGLQAEVLSWDEQADALVLQGNEAGARHAIEQLRRKQQHLQMAENDLRDHQLVTQELIRRVNMLEAAVADARRRQQAEEQAQQQAQESAQAAAEAKSQPSGGLLSDVLRDAREKISGLENVIKTKDEMAAKDGSSAPEQPNTDEEIDDDLARRRQRLSK
jgi:phage shock protein A